MLVDGEVVVDTTDFDRAAEVLHRRVLGRRRRSHRIHCLNEDRRMKRSLLLASCSLDRLRLRAARRRRQVCRNIILPEQRASTTTIPASCRPLASRKAAAANRHRPRPETRRMAAVAGRGHPHRPGERPRHPRAGRDHGGLQRPDHLRRGHHQHHHRPGQARFDPVLAQTNLWSRTNTPFAISTRSTRRARSSPARRLTRIAATWA